MSSKFAISLLGLTVAAAVAAVGTSVYTARKLDEQIQKTIEPGIRFTLLRNSVIT